MKHTPSNKSFKKALPYIFIILVPVLIIIIFAVFFNKPKQSLADNINDSSIDWSSYQEDTIELLSSLKITSPGIYTLTGSLANGSIEVDTTGVVKLILDNVSITNQNGPAILISEAKTVIIETAEDSVNTLIDSAVYSIADEDVCATVFSKDDLVLQGSGKLIVEGNHEDAIVSKDDLKIVSGIYEINSKDEGIRGHDSVYIADGAFIINSGGDAIKSNNSEEVGKGTVLIDDGEITISAEDDGIHAESYLEINGGIIDIKKSYEGLEGSKITINNGDIKIIASDDGINAAGGNDGSSPNMNNYKSSSSEYSITINGGKVYVNSLGDGIDSNGSLIVNDGEIVVDGPSNSANGALDAETGTVFNGGSIIALGASGMATAPVSSSAGYSISIFFASNYTAGTIISVKDSDDVTILSHASSKSFNHVVFSSSNFEEGETYTIFINDQKYESVTLSQKTTQLGSGGGMIRGSQPPRGNFSKP